MKINSMREKKTLWGCSASDKKKGAFFFACASALFCICAAAADPGMSESRDSVYNLEAVAVTGSRSAMELGVSARIVSVLDSVTLASMPAMSVNDVLKYSAGVDVRQRGAMGMQTDISVRGGTFDQIAVLLNGINICDPQTGHNAVDFPVSTNEIDRIEILEGPAARVYGTSSLVGAINIVTKKAADNKTSVHLEGGSYGLLNGGMSHDISRGRFSSQLSYSFSRSDGYSRSDSGRLNMDFRGNKAFWSGQYRADAADFEWQLGISGKGFGSNTFYSARYDNQYERTAKTFTSLSMKSRGKLSFQPALYWNRGTDRFELFRGDPSSVPYNRHRTNVLGANIGAEYTSVAGRTSFGAEIRNEDIVSTNLGDPLKKPKGKDGRYVVGRNRTNLNLYLDHSLILRKFTFSAGISAIRNSATHEGFGFYPGADASLRISDSWKLYASYNTSLRMPTFTELYYSVGGHKADRNLNPEKMQSLEGGVKYIKSGFSAVLSVYAHHGTDMLDWVRTISEGDDAMWRSVNYTEVNTLGEEITLRFNLPVMLGYRDFFVRNVYLGYSHIDQDKKQEPDIQSRYALEYLRNKIVAVADFHIWNRLFLNLSCRWHDRVGGYELFENHVSTGRKVSYEPYTLLDARLNWNSDRLKIYVEGDNLLDKTYYDHGNIPQPGFWFRGGVVFTF